MKLFKNKLLAFFSLLHIAAFSQETNKQLAQYNAQSIIQQANKRFFIENKGQWHPDVLYLCRMGGFDAWITNYGVNYTFYKVEHNSNTNKKVDAVFNPKDRLRNDDDVLLGHRVLFELQGHKPNPAKEGKQKLEGYYNYLIGNDPSKHASFVGLYKEAVVKDVYQGIDIRYYFDKGSLRYDFIVHPNADPNQIKFTLRGQDNVYTKGESKLCFTTRFGEVQMTDLHTYQENKTITSQFVKNGDTWQFDIGTYDKSRTLIIDPLIFSTYIGGSNDDYGFDIAIDAVGNSYITGTTLSTNYDTTSGAFQLNYAGNGDAFVTKFNTSGSGLIYSTYIGGSNGEDGVALAVNDSGQVFVVGASTSSNFSTTTGAFQTTLGGASDVFVTKLNSLGSALLYSTFIGGSSNDFGNEIAIDTGGNAYITGYTQSNNFDITTGAFQTSNGSLQDVFVTKLNSTGTGLIYSTYIGGNGDDLGYAISLNSNGEAWVTGFTTSSNYDVTTGAFQTTLGGGTDAFVTRLNSTGTTLVYSTYLGGGSDERGYGIVVDANNHAFITGYTNSNNFDITSGVYQTTYSGSSDVFVTKLSDDGTSLIYSTYLGGSLNDTGNDIAIDNSGNAYIVGNTRSTDFVVTSGAIQSLSGFLDVFVTKINDDGTSIVYSTFLGGSLNDYGNSIALDTNRIIYITGNTTSTDFNVTSGAYQSTLDGTSNDVFIIKLCTGSLISLSLNSSAETENQTICVNTPISNIIYSTSDATAALFNGLPSGVFGNFINDTITISGIPTAIGIFNYTVILTGDCSPATVSGTLTVNDCSSGIASNDALNNLSIYPNPASSHVVISGTISGSTLKIMDMTGKIVRVENIHADTHILSVQLLADGVYIIHIEKDGTRIQKKLVVNK
jgi:hypothetical protein